MTLYEELGMSAEQLTQRGLANQSKMSFRNEPYEHVVFVVGDPQEFAEIAHYARAHLGHDPVRHYERYKAVGGLTINWQHYNVTYTMVCLHVNRLAYYNPRELRDFLENAVHEQQHMLTRIERIKNADYRDEDEPRAYSTMYSFGMIMEILRKNWNVHIVAAPAFMVPRMKTLDEVCNIMHATISKSDIYSGVIQQHMARASGLVEMKKDLWRATTYFSGGEDV